MQNIKHSRRCRRVETRKLPQFVSLPSKHSEIVHLLRYVYFVLIIRMEMHVYREDAFEATHGMKTQPCSHVFGEMKEAKSGT